MKKFFKNFEENARIFTRRKTEEGSFGRVILSKIISVLISLINFVGLGKDSSHGLKNNQLQNQTQSQNYIQTQSQSRDQQIQGQNQNQSYTQSQKLTRSQNQGQQQTIQRQTRSDAQNPQTQSQKQTQSQSRDQQIQGQNQNQSHTQSQKLTQSNAQNPQTQSNNQTQPRTQTQQIQGQNQNQSHTQSQKLTQSNAQNPQTHSQNYAQPEINYKDRGFGAPSVFYSTRINEFIHVKNQGKNIFFDKEKSGIICRIKASDLRPKEKKGEETLLILADPDLDLKMAGESKIDYGAVSTEVFFTYKEKHKEKTFEAIFKVEFGIVSIELRYGENKFSAGSIYLFSEDSYVDIYSKSDGTFECKSVTYRDDLGAEMKAKFPIIFDIKNTKRAVVNVMKPNPYYKQNLPYASSAPSEFSRQ